MANGTNSRRLARMWPYPRHNQFVEHLKQAAMDWFGKRECAMHPKYRYRLADPADWHGNIILPEVVAYIEKVRQDRAFTKRGFALHKDVHNGLSSQALLFNLIGLLVVRDDLEPLRRALRAANLIWPGSSQEVVFEHEDRSLFNEDSGQPTSIDLVIGDPNVAGSVFIECKLVETRFGGCSVFENGDCDGANPTADLSRCYLHFIGRRYWILLEKHGFLEGQISKDTSCALANHYQFFRLVLFALERSGTFVLLSDERSPAFFCRGPMGERGLVPLLLRYIPERAWARVRWLSIQDVVSSLAASGRHDDWLLEFKAKYGMT